MPETLAAGEAIIQLRASADMIAQDLSKLTATVEQRLKPVEESVNRTFGSKLQAGFDVAWKAAIGLNQALQLAERAWGAVSRVVSKFTTDIAEHGDALDEMAQRYGINVETLSAFELAAKDSGVEIGQLAIAFKTTSVGLVDMTNGTGEVKQGLDRLKISAENANGSLKTSDQVMLEVAEKFVKMEDGAEKASIAAQGFGSRAGPNLIPLLNQGKKGIEGWIETAKRLGVVMTTDLAKKSDEYMRTMLTLKAAFAGVGMTIAPTLIPMVTDLAKAITGWAESNRELIATKITDFFATFTSDLGKLAAASKPMIDKVSEGMRSLRALFLDAGKNPLGLKDVTDDTQFKALDEAKVKWKALGNEIDTNRAKIAALNEELKRRDLAPGQAMEFVKQRGELLAKDEELNAERVKTKTLVNSLTKAEEDHAAALKKTAEAEGKVKLATKLTAEQSAKLVAAKQVLLDAEAKRADEALAKDQTRGNKRIEMQRKLVEEHKKAGIDTELSGEDAALEAIVKQEEIRAEQLKKQAESEKQRRKDMLLGKDALSDEEKAKKTIAELEGATAKHSEGSLASLTMIVPKQEAWSTALSASEVSARMIYEYLKKASEITITQPLGKGTAPVLNDPRFGGRESDSGQGDGDAGKAGGASGASRLSSSMLAALQGGVSPSAATAARSITGYRNLTGPSAGAGTSGSASGVSGAALSAEIVLSIGGQKHRTRTDRDTYEAVTRELARQRATHGTG